jgi:hypothetical protein
MLSLRLGVCPTVVRTSYTVERAGTAFAELGGDRPSPDAAASTAFDTH